MPALEVSDLPHFATLWPASGGVDGYGEQKIGVHVEIRCRWVDGKSQGTDPQGNSVSLDASVVVDREVPVDSVMWNGRLKDWQNTGDQELMEVVTTDTTPDLKGRRFCRELGLRRWRGTLPEAD